MTEDYTHLADGTEITQPSWSDQEMPTAEEWLDWFLEQSRPAQLLISEYSLVAERGAAQLIEAFKEAIGELQRDEMPAPTAIGALFAAYYRLDPRLHEANRD